MITEVRVKLVDYSVVHGDHEGNGNSNGSASAASNDKLLAFCSITLGNSFVIRDLKIIASFKGPFVAMPSRKLADRCRRCRSKNHLRARFCNECGTQLDPERAARDHRGRSKLHADISHPINAQARQEMQEAVLEAYEAELERARKPGYQPAHFEDDYDD